MNYNEQEKSAHTLFGETFNNNEINDLGGEYPPEQEESFSSNEKESFGEIPDQNESNKDKQKNKKNQRTFRDLNLTKYLSSVVALTLTAGVAITIPLISSKPTLVFENENIGLTTYECVLDAGEFEFNLEATITSKAGEKHTLNMDKQNTDYIFNCDNLKPETTYDINVIDQEGRTQFSKQFTTQPFINLTTPTNNKIYFEFHKDISFENDFILNLTNSNGEEFNSNLIFDSPEDINLNYIYLEGLYSDNYTLSLQTFVFGQDEPNIYEKQLELGNLTKLNFSIDIQTTAGSLDSVNQININYLSGDILPYSIAEIYLLDEQTWQSYTFTEFNIDENNNIIVSMNEMINIGNYKVIMYGVYESQEVTLYNLIWQGVLNITSEMIPQ